MNNLSVQAMLAISSPELISKQVLDDLVEKMPVVQGADPAWGMLLEDVGEYESVEKCLDAIHSKIESVGWPPRESGLLLRVAIYNSAFTYTGRISPCEKFVDHGVVLEISVYPVDEDESAVDEDGSPVDEK